MKKILVIIIAMLGIASVNAQVKDLGLKVIGQLGFGANAISSGVKGVDDGCALSPSMEFSFGTNVAPKFYLGAGVGYEGFFGVGDYKGSASHCGKVFLHSRYYFTPDEECSGIVDVKTGYARDFKSDENLLTLFIGPGYLFGSKYSLSVGYVGTFGLGEMSGEMHGGAVKFGIEF